jgi:hypothetical protein
MLNWPDCGALEVLPERQRLRWPAEDLSQRAREGWKRHTCRASMRAAITVIPFRRSPFGLTSPNTGSRCTHDLAGRLPVRSLLPAGSDKKNIKAGKRRPGDNTMSDAPATPEPNQTHQDMIDAVLFKRNLDEVFLLLDFISGRPEKRLSNLRVPDLMGGPDLRAQQVVTQLASIRYPAPPGRPPSERAADASFLLLAKDCLATLAYPARGLTIAYTALFARTEVGSATGHFWTKWLPGKPAAPPDGSRSSLAESAFPGLSAQVRSFNILYMALIFCTFVSLMLSTFAYWDVAMGRSTLQRIDQIHKDRASLYQASSDFALDDACAVKPSTQQAIACRRLKDLADAEETAKIDLVNFRDCRGWFCKRVIHVVRWGFILCGVRKGTMHEEQSAISLLAVFSNFVLPMMFGVLGTFVAAIRLVQINVRDSTLSPRDFWSTLLSLPLGMVAGLAVGLFYSPTGAPMTGGGTAAVDLTMTTSGLGFLAGYGSQTFFDMLDLLKKNAFAMNNTAPKPNPPV